MSARRALHLAVAIAAIGLGMAHRSAAQSQDLSADQPPPKAAARPPKLGAKAEAQGAKADHSAHQKKTTEEQPTAPPVTDDDRAAAFPDVQGHAVHDDVVSYFVLFDQLEWQTGGDNGLNWDNKGWIGRDVNRLWFRSEVESEDGRVGEAEAHVLYGRAIARWWEVVGGVRQDFRPGPARTWAAIGLQGLAPYWFEVEATAYVGESGRTALRFETEYELLLTNRLIVQPIIEVNLYGKSDPERGIGAGLSTIDTGFRLRYEVRREVAPYIGVTWNRTFGKTADFAEAAGRETSGTRLAIGARIWF